jgi:hypothetical protein
MEDTGASPAAKLLTISWFIVLKHYLREENIFVKHVVTDPKPQNRLVLCMVLYIFVK